MEADCPSLGMLVCSSARSTLQAALSGEPSGADSMTAAIAGWTMSSLLLRRFAPSWARIASSFDLISTNSCSLVSISAFAVLTSFVSSSIFFSFVDDASFFVLMAFPKLQSSSRGLSPVEGQVLL